MHNKAPSTSLLLQGIPVWGGAAVGQIWVSHSPYDLHGIEDHIILDTHKREEKQRFLTALHQTRNDILNLKSTFPLFSLLEATASILESQILQDNIIKLIELGHWAPFALKKTIEKYGSDFEQIENPYLRSRKADLLDLGQKILTHLQRDSIVPSLDRLPEQIILIVNKLSVISLIDIPRDRLKGIISSKGTSYSHIAILAKAMGIPAVMGVNDLPDTLSASDQILINGTTGEVCISPTKEMLQKMHDSKQENILYDAKRVIDNLPITLCVNTDACSDMDQAIALGAKEVGLYRSEVAFMMYDQFPSESVQHEIYKEVLTRFAPYPVSIRVLDVGADKPLPYFTPLLELRGIRMMLAHPDFFLSQLRAMLRASQGLNNLKILLPMIASISDLDDSIELIHQAYQEVVGQGNIAYPEIGAMIEVPCAIFQIEAIVQRVDFLSVGSNDLVQYLLAIDRGNSQAAHSYDCLHPAVLKALQIAVQSAHSQNKKISICGEMASDPVCAIALLGLEFDILSMQAQNLPMVSSVLRYFTLEQARALVEQALQMDHARDIRLHLENALVGI